ncbi:hypothetical protein F2Q70_00029451 [Brassica cretica]|uniref:Uncharacterized protein n=1 Tax=Brassica cretica TaxID=69181 RepID=A0A8S9FGZ9_BRACR|nr:hypothetical protein F2Q70_00029451 [Brassica cretica]KAF3593618.1 hypothetical protein DY000_02021109 [Brassica cretica]
MKKMCLREVLSEWLEQEPTEKPCNAISLAPATVLGQTLMKMATMKTVIQAKTMARVSLSTGCSLCSSYSALFLLWSYRKQNIAFNESIDQR